MRFSPRFLKVFLRLPAPSFFSGVAPSGVAAAASLFAICSFQLSALGCQPSAVLDDLLLRDGALARTLARARVGARTLAAHRQAAAVPHPAETADLHQPLDVHRDLLAEIALDAALFLDDAADLAHIVFG